MISNPCSWGSWADPIKFTHSGGSTLYHFCPDEELDEVFHHWIPINLIFFANSKEHAAEIIEQMLKMRLSVPEKEESQYLNTTRTLKVPEILLSKKDKWVITEAPTNQFYQVGWACNDTIL